MATGLGAPGPGRFAAADVVVRADPTVQLGHGKTAPRRSTCRAAPCRLRAAVDRVAAVPGVRAAVGDVAYSLTVIGATAAGMVATEVFLLDRGLSNQSSGWTAAG